VAKKSFCSKIYLAVILHSCILVYSSSATPQPILGSWDRKDENLAHSSCEDRAGQHVLYWWTIHSFISNLDENPDNDIIQWS
jgi:hypothetical protein